MGFALIRGWYWVCSSALQKTINIYKVALIWAPEAKMKRGCVKSTQETIETDLQALNLNIGTRIDRENIQSLKLQSNDDNDDL